MSTFTYNKPGIGNVGSYQVSGHPWLTGSQIANGAEDAHEFPYVAKHLLVKVSGSGEVRVHFNSTSSAGDVIGGKHFVTVTSGAGYAYGRKHELERTSKIAVPVNSEHSLFYINLWDGKLDIETVVPEYKLNVGKVIIPVPGTTAQIADDADDDGLDGYVFYISAGHSPRDR